MLLLIWGEPTKRPTTSKKHLENYLKATTLDGHTRLLICAPGIFIAVNRKSRALLRHLRKPRPFKALGNAEGIAEVQRACAEYSFAGSGRYRRVESAISGGSGNREGDGQ